MRKKVFGRQFKRDTDERKGLFKSLINAVVLQERIETTEEKAKAIKGDLEKLVTKVKKYGEKADRFLMPYLTPDAVKKMVSDIAPRFVNRSGGYTRIIKVGNRFGDRAKMAILEWVEKSEAGITKQEGKKTEVSKEKKTANEIKEAEIITEEKKTKKIVSKKTKEKEAKKGKIT